MNGATPSSGTVRLSSSDKVLPLYGILPILFSNYWNTFLTSSTSFITPTLLSTTAIAEYGFGVILSPSFSLPWGSSVRKLTDKITRPSPRGFPFKPLSSIECLVRESLISLGTRLV